MRRHRPPLPFAAQSGPRGELQKVNQLRQEKIKEKKALRDQIGSMKRIDMVSRRLHCDRLSVWSAGPAAAAFLRSLALQPSATAARRS